MKISIKLLTIAVFGTLTSNAFAKNSASSETSEPVLLPIDESCDSNEELHSFYQSLEKSISGKEAKGGLNWAL